MYINKYKITAHSNSCTSSNFRNKVCKCNDLNRVSSIKYLGLFIDENLKWNVHINYINKLPRKFFYVCKPLRFKMKKLIYIAIIQSILSYGISFWEGTYNSNLLLINLHYFQHLNCINS